MGSAQGLGSIGPRNSLLRAAQSGRACVVAGSDRTILSMHRQLLLELLQRDLPVRARVRHRILPNPILSPKPYTLN